MQNHMHPPVDHLPHGLHSEAIHWLQNVWPVQTRLWSLPGEPRWIRARPAPPGFPRGLPTVRIAGSCQNTQPDGLYLRFGAQPNPHGEGYIDPFATGFVDMIAIEVCLPAAISDGNRSMYCPSTYSRTVYVPANWLRQNIPVQGGRQVPIWRVTGIFEDEPACDLHLPVRHLRVLYAIMDDLWQRVCCYALNAHEFLFRHTQLGQYNAPLIQVFLKLMKPTANIFNGGN